MILNKFNYFKSFFELIKLNFIFYASFIILIALIYKNNNAIYLLNVFYSFNLLVFQLFVKLTIYQFLSF